VPVVAPPVLTGSEAIDKQRAHHTDRETRKALGRGRVSYPFHFSLQGSEPERASGEHTPRPEDRLLRKVWSD
jgi:hypothetical protein